MWRVPGTRSAVKPSRWERWPSWKIQTTTPNDAPIDTRFITTALTGSSTDPNARNNRTRVTVAMIAAIHGR